MAEDIAFKIQLGIILPKLKDKVARDMSAIIEELVDIVKAGTLGEDQVSLEAVKEIIMKDLEIFLDDAIFPEIDKKLNPPQEAVAEDEQGQEEGEEESEEQGGEEA
jgi:hypothetical protein